MQPTNFSLSFYKGGYKSDFPAQVWHHFSQSLIQNFTNNQTVLKEAAIDLIFKWYLHPFSGVLLKGGHFKMKAEIQM